jgi:hypothetical protein
MYFCSQHKKEEMCDNIPFLSVPDLCKASLSASLEFCYLYFTRPCWRVCVGYSMSVLDTVQDVSCVVSRSTLPVKGCSSGCSVSLR